MDSKQNDNDAQKVETLDFSEKEKNHSEIGKEKRANKFLKSIKDGFSKLAEKFKNISIERQAHIIVGGLMIFSLMIGFFGDLVILLLAAGILFIGISGKPVFNKFLKKRSWNKKEEKDISENQKVEE